MNGVLVTRFETDVALIALYNDSICIIRFKDNSDIEKHHIQEIQKKIEVQLQGRKIAVLVDPGQNTTNAPESRAYAASKEGSRFSVARAILTRNLATRLIGKLYINYNKPVVHTRLFREEEKALNWLRNQVRQIA